MHRKYILITLLFFRAALQAVEVETEELPTSTPLVPWFTGPLLAPSGNVVPLGSLNVEPYLFITAYTGTYNLEWKTQSSPAVFWEYALTIPIQFGIAPGMDFTITPSAFYNKTLGKHKWGVGDLLLATSFQLFRETPHLPSIRLGFQELFPTGQYTGLDPTNFLTDGTGLGAYTTSVGLIFSKLIQIEGVHYLNLRLGSAASFPSAVKLNGLSTYGGSPDTKGTLYPPQIMTVDLGLEYAFTRNWVGAIDVLYNYATRGKFMGKNGENVVSSIGGVLEDVSSQISLAPALEYNFNVSLGLIAGCWLTIAGRNANIFRSGVIAFNYYK